MRNDNGVQVEGDAVDMMVHDHYVVVPDRVLAYTAL
jgi:hypothetical protein